MVKNIYFDGKTDTLSMRQESLLCLIKDKDIRRMERTNLRNKNALVLIQLDGLIHTLRTYEEGHEQIEVYEDYFHIAIHNLIQVENKIHYEHSEKEEN
tara:strand:- start:528 stop:821 length:294 start_codon:yes stop_codon:yes gene_type:complete